MSSSTVSTRPAWNEGKPTEAIQLFIHTQQDGRVTLNSLGWGHRSTESEFPRFTVVDIPATQLQQDESIFFIAESLMVYCEKVGFPLHLNIAGIVPEVESDELFYYFPATLTEIDNLMNQADMFLGAAVNEGLQETIETGLSTLNMIQQAPLLSICSNDFLDLISNVRNILVEAEKKILNKTSSLPKKT